MRADGIGYVELGRDAGLDVDLFAPRLSFFWDIHNDFFEEIAKLRAARRMWAGMYLLRGVFSPSGARDSGLAPGPECVATAGDRRDRTTAPNFRRFRIASSSMSARSSTAAASLVGLERARHREPRDQRSLPGAHTAGHGKAALAGGLARMPPAARSAGAGV